MKLVIECDVSQRRGGVSATARQLGLTGHGHDRDAALASLRRAAAAWAMGLTLAGRLAEALGRRGVRCEDKDSEGWVIDLRVA
jgi:hypothetical protein